MRVAIRGPRSVRMGVPVVAAQIAVVPSGWRTQMPRPGARVDVKAIAPVARFTAGIASSARSIVSCVSAPLASSTCQMS